MWGLQYTERERELDVRMMASLTHSGVCIHPDMMVKPGHPHVTSEGFVKIPYTADWRQVRVLCIQRGGHLSLSLAPLLANVT